MRGSYANEWSSCGSQTAARPLRFLRHCGRGPRLSGCLFAERRQRVETSTGPPFSGGDLWIFGAALEQPHLFQTAERSIERPVRRQQASVRRVGERLGDLIPVEGRVAAAKQIGRGEADTLFERNE
jgi:hypothetical protein